MPIRPQILALTEPLASSQEQPGHEIDFITVSAATRRIAFAYERFRNTLEPDEADILRRKATARILERRLSENRPANVAAEQILQELIRASYIQPVSRDFARHLARHLEAARQILPRLSPSLAAWFIRLLAVSLDRDLFPHSLEEELVRLMYEDTCARVEWMDNLVAPEDRPTQLYIACHRVLFEIDDFEISYHYFLHHFPKWEDPEVTAGELTELAGSLPQFYKKMHLALNHPARERVVFLLRPIAVPYRILRDVLHKDPRSVSDPKLLPEATGAAISERVRRLQASMGKRAWHSILFLFFTKTIIALFLEVPYELLLRHFNWLALSINIAFHPLLLFFLTTAARFPGADNTARIIDEVQKIAEGEVMHTVILRRARRYGALTWSLFAMFYAVLFLAIFWGLSSVLDALGFSLMAMVIFVIFLGLVSFLAIRIRRSVDQLRILPRREGLVGTLVTFGSLPVLELGKWLAHNIQQINVALFVMDKILEAPFKLLIDVIEEWFTFVRDRREEIV